MKRIYLILLCITFIGCLLRFYHLQSLPPSLTWDEASWGYNAYSLGIDGKDEFGRFLPLTYLESFGDFKPPLYAYLSVIPVKVFGLNEFSTRFASAFLGTFTIVLVFFLTREIFTTLNEKKRDFIAITGAALLAISPWHIMLSRAAFEANVSTFFIILGVWLFLRSLRTKPYLLLFSLISFVLSMYTFNTARIVSPLLVMGLFISSYRYVLKSKMYTILSCLGAFIVFFPLLLFLRTPQSQLRFQEVNIFTDSSVVFRANQEIENNNNASWSKIIHNRRLQYGVEYLRHYFDNLNPQFLFIKGDGNPKFSIQDVGELYIWEIPFLILGSLFLFRSRQGKWWIIPYWLVIGIMPAATARETPHALRIEAAIPTFQLLSAYGVYSVFESNWITEKIEIFKKSFSYKYLGLGIWGLTSFLCFVYFAHTYFIHYAREYSGEWQYGYKDAIAYIKEVQNQYDEIQFTQKLGRPYMYMLFYLQYSPHKFRENAQVTREVLGFVHVNSFHKYFFPEKIDSSKPTKMRILYIEDPKFVPHDAKKLTEFKLLNGETTLVAFTK